MNARRVAVAAVDLLLAAALGAAARATHVLWYRSFEASVAVDLAGSVAMGAVFGVGHVLVASGDRLFGRADRGADSWVWRPRWVALAAGIGFLCHVGVAPAFTPFGLAAPGVNTALTAAGGLVGLWSLAVRRAAR